MKNNYKKMEGKDLLTSIYTDAKFRKDYFKWTRIGGYKNNKAIVNKIVVDYENYLYDKLNASWLGKLRYENIDLMDYNSHKKQIRAFLNES